MQAEANGWVISAEVLIEPERGEGLPPRVVRIAVYQTDAEWQQAPPLREKLIPPVELPGYELVPLRHSASATLFAYVDHVRRVSVDRATGEPIRRYEHDEPASLLHVDVKKLGNIPDGGGHRYLGRELGKKNRHITARASGRPRSKNHAPLMGTFFVHTVIDDHSRVAYAEIHDDETAATAIGVLRRPVAWFAARGVTVQRVLEDNGSAYRSHAWRDTCAEIGITPKLTRPYRPQTNGKIERFHRTMADGWAFSRMFLSESARRKALPAWLHEYNHHRPHTTIGKNSPITRLSNLAGQYN